MEQAGHQASRPDAGAVLRTLPDGVVTIDADGVVTGAWGACAAVFGDECEDLIGVDAFSRVHPDDIAFAAGAMFEAIGRDSEHVPANIRVRAADGRWVVVEASAGTSAELGSSALLLSLRPLAYRGHLEERRAELHRRCLEIATGLASAHASALEEALARAVASISEFFHTAGVRFCAPGATVDTASPVDWPPESVFDRDGFVDHGRLGNHHVYEVEFPADGPARWWLAWTQDDPGMAGWDGAHLEHLRLAGAIAASAAARLVLEADLVRRARLDSLTGLDNRTELTSTLRRMLNEGPVTVLFCDLDGFKEANDLHGHAFGDAVLAQAAERLSWGLRASDVLGRFGGDEFVAACPFMESADAVAVVGRLETALREPIEVDGERITVGVSIGSASAPRGADAASLIAAADEAMYRVKAARRALSS
jgi:diguanylate cyclase (GGDEF)-like protein/PAS domain S-box-containing protein